MIPLFARSVRDRATAAGVLFTDEQLEQLFRYWELLARWNRTMNLTSLPMNEYPDSTVDRLLIEPAIAARYFPADMSAWIDVGSGGGSPAIPLKIVRPAVPLTMVESRDRKAAFLREAIRELELDQTQVCVGRVEVVSATSGAAAADAITMRAVKLDDSILHAVAHLLRRSGMFLLFGSISTMAAETVQAATRLFIPQTSVLLPAADGRLFPLVRR